VKGHFLVQTAAVLAIAACLSGCATFSTGALHIADKKVRIIGFSPCSPADDTAVAIDPKRPVAVIVHGCNSSHRKMKTLAQVIAARGQQTVCFSYNHRLAISETADRLALSLAELRKELAPQPITVIGHSQGGLVARAAVSSSKWPNGIDPGAFSLVTVSSPFGGITSSADCGKTWLHVVTLGITVAVCQAIAGDKWREIYPGSNFITRAKKLQAFVNGHLVVQTDERGTCRARAADGSCDQDDFVFTLDEQHNKTMFADARVRTDRIAVGHAAVIGERGTPPTKLLSVLEKHRVLAPVSASMRAHYLLVMRRLYGPFIERSPAPAPRRSASVATTPAG